MFILESSALWFSLELVLVENARPLAFGHRDNSFVVTPGQVIINSIIRPVTLGLVWVRKDINRKKTFSFGHCPNEGGGSTHARIFGPFSRSAFLVNKKSLFLQKCQCIELLTVF